ncbi:hypothetical protein [Campylobacter sp. RM12651]|uniref:hypothetical protein n=1 Tax=Campylobacter sp. RM12651 TaxID=1660079 RepID=UPI001EFB817B|nr:hypothetical protein [Campylobacter sp. RM12651]
MITRQKLKKIKEQLLKDILDLQNKIENPKDFSQLIHLLQNREIILERKEKQILEILMDVEKTL